MSQFESSEKSNNCRKRKALTHEPKKKAKKAKVDSQDKNLPLKQVKPVNSNILCTKNEQLLVQSKATNVVTIHKDDSSLTNGKMSRWKKRRLHFKQQKKASKYSLTKEKSGYSKCSIATIGEKDASQIILPHQEVNSKDSVSKHSVKGSLDHLKHGDKNIACVDRNMERENDSESTNLSTNWKNFQLVLKKMKDQITSPRRKVSTNKHKHSKTSINVKMDASRNDKSRNKQMSSTSEKKMNFESQKKTSRPDIWFDDVDEILIEGIEEKSVITEKKVNELVKLGTYDGVTKAVAMDCEMVGVGEEGRESVLARVSLVNQYGNCIYDKFVQPQETVVDYRTFVSGITPEHLVNAEEFSLVQKEVCDILKGKILVGHALSNDLKVLFLDHSWKKVRDTSTYKPFRQLFGGKTPSLKKLTAKLLGVSVQEGKHDSVQDAQAAMRLYTMHRKHWEKEIKTGVIKLRKEKKHKIRR